MGSALAATRRGTCDLATSRDVAVVIVLHNSADVLEECLATVPGESEVIVVDNASSDVGLAVAKRARPDAICISAGANLGFGAGCNLGWRAATRPFVAFLNPDVRIRPHGLDHLAQRVAAAPMCVVGPAIRREDGALWPCRSRTTPLSEAAALLPAARRWADNRTSGNLDDDDPTYYRGGRVARLEGACFVIRRGDLAVIGGFDEDLFLFEEEESVAQRLRTLGGAALYEPRAEVVHLGSSSVKSIGTRALSHRYRSKVIVYRKRMGDLRGRLGAGVLLAGALAGLPAMLFKPDPRLAIRQRCAIVRGIVAGAWARTTSTVRY